MVNSVQGSSYNYINTMPSSNVGTVPNNSFPIPTGTGFAGDNLNFSLSGNNNPNNNAIENANKKASFFKSMGNKVGNFVNKMLGIGTINTYAKQSFESFDTDKSKTIDTSEFGAVSALIGQTFEQADSNSDQEIKLKEFKSIINGIVDANFDIADTDGDGFMNYNEAAASGNIVDVGSNNSFLSHDANQDQLLSKSEYLNLASDPRFGKRI